MPSNTTKRRTIRHHASPNGKCQYHLRSILPKTINLTLINALDLNTVQTYKQYRGEEHVKTKENRTKIHKRNPDCEKFCTSNDPVYF